MLLQDITDLKKLEQMRKEFIANISHELKTPLTSIGGFVETVYDELEDDNLSHKEFLKIISEEVERLTRLIDDLTTISRLETRAEPIEFVEVEAQPFIEKIQSIAIEGWKTNRVKLYTNNIQEGLFCLADPDKIQQALLNLIDNALQHNSEGTTVKIKVVSVGDHVRFSIIDNGSGIPAIELERIFERFYRVEKSRYKDYGGTGLGLSIAKHVLKAHHTQLFVRSKRGVGTAFYFYLPRVHR